MTAAGSVVAAIALAATSGVPGLLLGRRSSRGERIAVAAMALAALFGAGGSLAVLAGTGPPSALSAGWAVPNGALQVEVDALSAVFLLPIFLVSFLGSVYGLAYWRQADHPRDGRKLRLFLGLLTAGLGLLVVARNAILFLAGWEIMAASAFFLVTTEDRKRDVCVAGNLYLLAARLGTLALFALFALLHAATGTFDFGAPGQVVAAPYRDAVFVLALLGFGLKAGIMPLHVWLPAAHASAPSHVSALMSGVLIKVGVYGLVRVATLLPDPPLAWAGIVLALGTVSAIGGVALALGQHDLKRLLAYHSVENIGIITIGLGVGLAGRALGRDDLVALGLGGALLHVWNHGLFKSLLFLSAGAVIHATGTRSIDALGGLARPMPRTALAFVVGAVAICGLPPLNGLVSELLVYLGLLGAVAVPAGGGAWLAAAFAVPALALVGGLAVACFVKVLGAVFLGSPRAARNGEVHDAPAAMALPMAALAALCAAIGLAPLALAPLLDRAISEWLPAAAAGVPLLAGIAPLAEVGALAVALAGLLAALALVLRWRWRATPGAAGLTWDCGYPAPSARMQYTSSSFAQMLVRLLSFLLFPRRHAPQVTGLHPQSSAFSSHVPDAVLDGAVLPAAGRLAAVFAWFRWFQRGSLHAYIAYVLVTLLVLHLFWR